MKHNHLMQLAALLTAGTMLLTGDHLYLLGKRRGENGD